MMFSEYLEYDTLINQLKKDDKIALRKIFNQFGMTLFLFSNALVKNKQSAEEIVEDSFISLWANRSSISNYNSLKNFLYITVKNASLKYLRMGGHSVEFKDHLIYTANENYERVLEKIIFDDLIKIIFCEVERLPAHLGRVFKLSFLDGLSATEVSSQLKIPQSAVLENNRDAMSLLRNTLLENEFALNLSLLKMICLGALG